MTEFLQSPAFDLIQSITGIALAAMYFWQTHRIEKLTSFLKMHRDWYAELADMLEKESGPAAPFRAHVSEIDKVIGR